MASWVFEDYCRDVACPAIAASAGCWLNCRIPTVGPSRIANHIHAHRANLRNRPVTQIRPLGQGQFDGSALVGIRAPWSSTWSSTWSATKRPPAGGGIGISAVYTNTYKYIH